MKQQKVNLFIISTPSQMINALEFINFMSLKEEDNKIIISCNSPEFISQIKKISALLTLQNFVLFSPKHNLIKVDLYNRMPLKLIRLYISKRRVLKLLKKKQVERLVLGNYSNFITNYCTQHCSSNFFVLDDGTSSLWIREKRICEIEKKIPIFEFNTNKKALWIVKLIMGFYPYKIPSQLTFFSSYITDVQPQDKLIINSYSYLKHLNNHQTIDLKKEYFIGSPISESGYVSEEREIEMILNYAKQIKKAKLIYIPHRLDSPMKIERIKQSIEVISFDLPIELVLAKNNFLPRKLIGFFTSALPNLVEIINEKVMFKSIKIPHHYYLTKKREQRVLNVYKTFASIERIKVIEYQSK